MAYRICYGPMKQQKHPQKYFIILLALILASALLYYGRLPGDPAVTAAALDNMAAAVGEGAQISDAFFCFCREIIDGANLPY